MKTAIAFLAWLLVVLSGPVGPAEEAARPAVRFAITADAHFRVQASASRTYLERFVRDVAPWRPDFVVDLGDFGVQSRSGQTTRQMHDAQLENLRQACAILARLPCARYHVLGNHDAGWIRGGEERLLPESLLGKSHSGEHITKDEFLQVTGMPRRYWSVDVKGLHLIFLDGNNPRPDGGPPPGRDGAAGAYAIDEAQKAWLAADLAAHRDKRKLVFCHEELHHTPPQGSGEGGDAPFPAVGKEASYVDNGWEVRKLLAADGRVVACFFGHKHRSRWTVYGGVHYFTLAALHQDGSFAKVTLTDRLVIEGVASQRSYEIPL